MSTTFVHPSSCPRPTPAQFRAVVPARYRYARRRPARRYGHSVFVRRRLAVLLVVVTIAAALGLGVGTVLANRGGVPASTSAVRPANPTAGVAAYAALPGDTMWSIATSFRGERSLDDYLDDLIRLNGGSTDIAVGQLVLLP